MSNPAGTIDQNLLPVQAYFDLQGNFQTFIGQNKPFYATVNPDQSGLHITNSTIDSSTIGATTPSTGVFTNIFSTTGQIATQPIGTTDIANKAYVDAVAQGLAPKQACKVATTGPITLSGLQTLDTTYTTVAGDRVLVKNQASSAQNGIYIASSGPWTRSADMDVWSEVPGSYTVILNGATQGNTSWVTTAADTGTIDVTPMPWVQFSGISAYYAGTGLTLSANTFSITNTGVTAASYGSASQSLSATVNAQGQLTSLSAQAIAIANTQVSGLGTMSTQNANNVAITGGSLTGTTINGSLNTLTNIGNSSLTNSSITINGNTVSLGGSTTVTAVNPYPLTIGTGLSGTSYDGSAAVTVAIANTGVVAASYSITNLTVNAQGQITSASNAATTGSGNVVLANGPTISALNIDNSNPYIQFANGSAVTSSPGRMWYDGSNGSLNFGMGGGNVVQQVGEELYVYGKASAVISGNNTLQAIYKTGTVGASGTIQFAPTIANITDGQKIIGVATEDIASGSFGRVTSFGIVHGVNTTGSTYGETWADNDDIWYNSTTGGLTKTKPVAPNVKVQIGTVINAGPGGSGSFQVLLNTGTVLGGTDANVQFGTLNDGDLIQYYAAGTYWRNVATSTVSVGTATNLAGGGAGYVPYQSASGTTLFVSAGTSGQVLTSNGSSAPTWTTPTAYATVTDDTTTNATRYPLFANVTTGNLTTEYVSSTKYQFNPSTGELTATGFTGSGANLTSLPAGQLSGTIPSGVLGNSTLYVGTTAIALNRASNSQTLTGTSIDGNAATATTATTATNATNVAITDDTSTNSGYYVTMVSASTGNTGMKTSSTKLQFNPSTGVITATGGIGGGNF